MNTNTEGTFREFIQYNNWANQQVLQACRALTAEQLDLQIPGAYGTIRDTLAHIYRAESWYVKLLTGTRPRPSFNWDDRLEPARLADYADQVGKALVDVAERIRPGEQVVEEVEGKRFTYPALAIFIQIIDHGIEHRTNITTLLNQMQANPPDVDGWAYLNAHPERFGSE